MADPKKKQFNIRLNGVAEQQLQELSDRYNLPKAAIIKMAVSSLYKRHFPDAPEEEGGDDPFEPETKSA